MREARQEACEEMDTARAQAAPVKFSIQGMQVLELGES
jgi:hypothetical protein